MLRYKSIAFASFILTACAFAAPQQADQNKPGRAITPHITWSGSYSSKSNAAFLRITDAKEWVSLWKEHCGDRIEKDSYGDPVVPEIDFSACTVIAMFDGRTWNTRSERLESAEEFTDRIRLRVDPVTYQTEGPDGGGERVTPYAIWVFQKNSKRLIIEVNTNDLIGNPPVWTQKAQFDAIQ